MTQARIRPEVQDFGEFYTAHFDSVTRQLYAYLGDRAEAQDVSQEAFCRALSRWERIGTYEDPVAWVRRVAWNLATSRLRHLRIAARHAAGQRVQHVPGPEPDRVALVRALSALPSKHRLAVVLHHVAGLPVAEIAAQHDVAEGTVKSWLARGRSRLAEHLGDEELRGPKLPGFVPPDVDAIAGRVTRARLVRRCATAAVLAVILAVPAVLALRARGEEPPFVEPTPTPSTSGSPAPSASAPAPPTVRRVAGTVRLGTGATDGPPGRGPGRRRGAGPARVDLPEPRHRLGRLQHLPSHPGARTGLRKHPGQDRRRGTDVDPGDPA